MELDSRRPAVLTITRVVIGLCFVVFGLTKLLGIQGTTAFIAKAGIPLPAVAFWAALIFETLAGLALIFGVRTREVAVALAVWCLATGLIFHHDLGDRAQRDQFLKNVVIAAALLHLGAARRQEGRQESLRS